MNRVPTVFVENGKNYKMLKQYMNLKQNDSIQVEYIWIGGTGSDIRSKVRTLKKTVSSIKDIPIWNYDGSSTEQADGDNSEIILKPIKIVPDPFRLGDNLLCLCETLDSDMKPIPTNKRAVAEATFSTKEVEMAEPWYGIEQEYTLFDSTGKIPLGWPKNGFPAPQGPYYCSVGTKNAHGRHIAEAHYRACLYAGLDISGINAEVMPGQWEYQVGPCVGIDSGDQCWLARFLLHKVAEDFGAMVSFEPKPVKGDWNGAGSHTNYSTKPMREEGGYKVIIAAAERLGRAHQAHMEVYGKKNEERLTGKHETARFDTFKYGVADRGASIRIPRQTELDQKGYLEDRRPAANCDPYEVTAIIARTTILNDPHGLNEKEEEEEAASLQVE